jgi:hypothetical protein
MAQRRGRNSIPAVNPNPRPPNEPRPRVSAAQPAGARVGVGQARPAGSRTGLGNNRAVSRPTKQGANPATSAPPASGSPPPQFAPPTDPRDARYWQDLAQLEFNKNIGEQKLNTEDTFEKTRFGREKSNLDYLAPIEVQRLREGANNAGAIYSTSTQEDLGNLGQEQFQRSAGLSEAFQQALSMRALQRNELLGNYNLGSSNLNLEAAERTSAAEAERAAVAPELMPEETGSIPGNPMQQALRKRISKPKFKRNDTISYKPKKKK